MVYSRSDHTEAAPQLGLETIKGDFIKCLENGDGRSISVILRMTREQLEDRPTVEFSLPIAFVALSLPALAILIIEVEHIPKLLMKAYEGTAADIILVSIYSFKSIWIDRGRRAEKELIMEWSTVAIKQALSKPGLVVQPLRKDEFDMLQMLTRKDSELAPLAQPILSLGIEPKRAMPDL